MANTTACACCGSTSDPTTQSYAVTGGLTPAGGGDPTPIPPGWFTTFCGTCVQKIKDGLALTIATFTADTPIFP